MGQRITGMTSGQSSLPVANSLFKFRQHGQSGAWLSELIPHHAKIVDDVAFIKTMNTDAINHDPAITFIQSGSQQPGRPSMGSWVSYGLGSENRNLPAFVVMISQANAINVDQPLFSRLWGSGFLPSSHQGVRFRGGVEPGPVPGRPAGHRQGHAPADAGRDRQTQPDALRRVRRSRDRNAHRAIRDGVPDADLGAGPGGPGEGAGVDVSNCTARMRANRARTRATA